MSVFDTIELICAMYTEEELAMSDSDKQAIEAHRLDSPITLQLKLEPSTSHPLEVQLSFSSSEDVSIRPAHPAWLNRSSYDSLLRSLPAQSESDDLTSHVVSSLEHIIHYASNLTVQNESPASTNDGEPEFTNPTLVVRTWHLLPSLSTKEKRIDLVNYAKSYKPPITGMVLAGKPGLIILEHPSASTIDSYWSEIKSKSWADIPASHKKVSERLRENDVTRVFEDIREMTRDAELGGREAMSGVRGNRNDLGFLEAWLDKKGLGGNLQLVLGADW